MTTGRSSGITVESLMTKSPVVVWDDEPVAPVAQLLSDLAISGLPVVDFNDHLVGVISQTDLARLRASLPWTGWHGLIVHDLMSTTPKAIAGSSDLKEAARRMTAEHCHRLVVVDARRIPIGIISDSDLIQKVADPGDDR